MARTKEERELLSPADAAWLHMERPTNPMTVTGMLVFERPLDFERLRAVVEERLLRHPRFRQRVVEPGLGLGRPHWELDPNFDLDAHVHRVALPHPGDEDALRALVSDLMSTRLDLARAPWQLHLVEGYGSGSALVARLHHCLGDGVALMRLLLSLADRPPGRPEQRPAPPPASGAHEGAAALLHPAHALDLARSGLRGAAALGKLLLLPSEPETGLKRALLGSRRAAWSAAIPLDRVKAAGRALGATVNDVLVAALAGALRRQLHGPAGKRGDVAIRAIVPVNIRPVEAEVELGNRFGLIFLSLPTEIADPVERLRETKRRMDEIKSTPEAVLAFAILQAIGAATPGIEDRVVDIFTSKASLVLTNVPGPGEPLLLAERRIRSVMFWVPQGGDIGLGASILSYAGHVRLGINADAAIACDPETTVRDFEHEVTALVHAASTAPLLARRAGLAEREEGVPMTRIERSALIDAPVADVFEYATTIARYPEWWSALVDVRDATQAQATTGGSYAWTYKMLGLKLHGVDEFVEVVPNALCRIRSRSGDLQHSFEHRFAAEDGKTRYTLVIEYAAPFGVVGGIADAILIRRTNEHEADHIVANLKSICESASAGATA